MFFTKLSSSVFRIALLWLLPFLQSHAVLEELKLPPESEIRWVGRDLVQNSRDMQIAVLESKLTTQAVVAFYQELWESHAQDGSPGSIVDQLREWSIVSTVIDNSLVVVQQKPDIGRNQSTGFISWMSLDGNGPSFSDGLPEPAGSTLISHTRSTDFNQTVNNLGEHSASATGTTTMLMNENSVASNFEFYRSVMQERGWRLVTEQFDHTKAALIFIKTGSTSEIAFSEYSDEQSVKTLIVTNQVGKGDFE